MTIVMKTTNKKADGNKIKQMTVKWKMNQEKQNDSLKLQKNQSRELQWNLQLLQIQKNTRCFVTKQP